MSAPWEQEDASELSHLRKRTYLHMTGQLSGDPLPQRGTNFPDPRKGNGSLEPKKKKKKKLQICVRTDTAAADSLKNRCGNRGSAEGAHSSLRVCAEGATGQVAQGVPEEPSTLPIVPHGPSLLYLLRSFPDTGATSTPDIPQCFGLDLKRPPEACLLPCSTPGRRYRAGR